MKNLLGFILDRLLVVLGAILFFQFPHFMHQYQQQLIGHVHELQWQVTAMEVQAVKTGKTLDDYIQKFIDHQDEDIGSQGLTMKRVQERWSKLSSALTQLDRSTLLTRPFIFLLYIQTDIFKSTFKSFEPGISFTLESFFYALVGIGAGLLCYHTLIRVCKNIFKSKKQLKSN